jgi:hypothetical protein
MASIIDDAKNLPVTVQWTDSFLPPEKLEDAERLLATD